MAFKSFYNKVGRVRFYSGNTPTPYFLEVPFRGNVTFPADRPRPAEILVLDRGRITQDMHYLSAPDNVILEPLPFSMSFRLANSEPNYSKLITILRSPGGTLTKTIGGRVWNTAKGTTQVRSGDPLGSSLHTTPSFTDPEKWCVNVEVLWEDSDGSNDRGFKLGDVYFPPQAQVTEGENDVMVAMSGEIYGNVSLITAFTAGTES